ncbi:MAG: ribosome small subunit-dependent GTPase A [Bacteroidota bacterium]|nr:ribosome small subunit-dependent GTPase A [Bacteroidota bacterium]
MAQGVVYRSTGSWYIIKDTKNKLWNARMKGVFKIEGITSTNPIAVGDVVDFETENEEESGATITKIHDRKNYINRQSPRVKYQHHIVAANVDQSIMVATIKEPRTSQGFIDRFLVACEMFHVPAIIIFNKHDVYRQKELAILKSFKSIYENIGYTVLTMSIKERMGMENVTALLQKKISLVSGHSGVGKSSFINEIIKEKNIRTKQISGWSGKGQHSTTFAEMHDLPFGGTIIDTPGMKEFGLVDIEKAELSGYFPEMKKRLNDCQFNNCLHMNEPGCAIKRAVIEGEIHEDRYVSYCSILDSIGEVGY